MSRLSPPPSETPPRRQKPTERAFVIHFEPIAGTRSRLRGRVEQVASGEGAQFRSAKQLLGFMVGALQRGASKSRGEES